MMQRLEPVDHAIGRSRGGLSTKVHQVCDGKGRPLVIAVGPGQGSDSKMFPYLLAGRCQVFCVRDRSISLSAGWSEGESVGELDGESVQRLVPSLGAGAELAAAAGFDVPDAQVDQLDRCLVRGERAAGLGDLP